MYTSPPNTSVTIHMDRGDWVSLTFDFFFLPQFLLAVILPTTLKSLNFKVGK